MWRVYRFTVGECAATEALCFRVFNNDLFMVMTFQIPVGVDPALAAAAKTSHLCIPMMQFHYAPLFGPGAAPECCFWLRPDPEADEKKRHQDQMFYPDTVYDMVLPLHMELMRITLQERGLIFPAVSFRGWTDGIGSYDAERSAVPIDVTRKKKRRRPPERPTMMIDDEALVTAPPPVPLCAVSSAPLPLQPLPLDDALSCGVTTGAVKTKFSSWSEFASFFGSDGS